MPSTTLCLARRVRVFAARLPAHDPAASSCQLSSRPGSVLRRAASGSCLPHGPAHGGISRADAPCTIGVSGVQPRHHVGRAVGVGVLRHAPKGGRILDALREERNRAGGHAVPGSRIRSTYVSPRGVRRLGRDRARLPPLRRRRTGNPPRPFVLRTKAPLSETGRGRPAGLSTRELTRRIRKEEGNGRRRTVRSRT